MSLALFTLVHAGTQAAWLEQACASAQHRLPPDAVHVVYHDSGDFQAARWETYRSEEHVACLDHDDRLEGEDPLGWCMQALQATGAGVAFTYEAQMDEQGRPLPVRHRAMTLRDVAMHPRSLHHLAVIRSDCIDPRIIDLARQHRIGIDWLVRAQVALQHGAVQVPRVGYSWRRHSRQASCVWSRPYEAAIPRIRRVLLDWLRHDRPIPTFEPVDRVVAHEDRHQLIPGHGPEDRGGAAAG